jgi:hypothetical protein
MGIRQMNQGRPTSMMIPIAATEYPSALVSRAGRTNGWYLPLLKM